MLKKHKNKFIAAAVVVVVLAASWVMGMRGQRVVVPETLPPAVAVTVDGAQAVVSPSGAGNPSVQSGETGAAESEAETESLGYEDATPDSEYYDTSDDDALAYDDYTDEAEGVHEGAEGEASSGDYEPEYAEEADSGEVSEEAAEEAAEEENGYAFVDPTTDELPVFREPPRPDGLYVPAGVARQIQTFAAEHPNMRDPVEPQNMEAGDEYFFVTLSVGAHMILYNMHLLHRDKHELVPEDGWIFPPTPVQVWEGESVHNVLQREMRRNRIHMSSRWTPVFNSAYVEAINNLFEFDVGELSGWMYRVNGWFPNFGASRYLLEPGDIVEWLYTVDLGRDFGVSWNAGDLGG